MIYKFLCKHDSSAELYHNETMEVSILKLNKDLVRFECNNEEYTAEIFLNKTDVFKLIGALHLLHKEMN